MSYPMNEIMTDAGHNLRHAISSDVSAAGAVENVCHEASNRMLSAIKRGKDHYRIAHKRMIQEADVVNAVVHKNPYPLFLVGVTVGALLGYFFSCRQGGRSI